MSLFLCTEQVDWLCDSIVHPLTSLQEEPGSPTRSGESALKLRATFRQCVSGDEHLVLVDRQGQAWSWMTGWGPQRGLVPNHRHQHQEEKQKDQEDGSNGDTNVVLTRIDYFQGLRVVSVTVGSHFNVALVEHTIVADQTAVEASIPPVVGAHRAMERQTVGDGTPQIGSCPLGLPIASKSNMPSQSQESPEIVDVFCEDKAHNDSTSSKPLEEKEDFDAKSEDVKRLSQSGMYINATDAIKYLSNQLSWTGRLPDTQSVDDDGIQTDRNASKPPDQAVETEEPAVNASTAVVSNIYKATSNVMVGGVKYMGQTVSRLSQSFSVSSEKDLHLNQHSDTAEDSRERLVANSSFERPPQPLMSAYTDAGSVNIQHRRSQSASMLDKLASPSQLSRAGSQMARSESPVSEKRRASSSLAAAVVPKYEVWFWGRGSRGQAGQGDMLDRFQPCQLTDLAFKMVRKVVCGRQHCLALTVTGTVYGWGDNSLGQACPTYSLAVCPMPTKWDLPRGETAADIAAVGSCSCVLTDCGNILWFGGGASSRELKSSLVQGHNEDDFIARSLYGGDRYLMVFDGPHDLPMCQFKSLEKLFLRTLQEIMRRVVEPLCCMPRSESKQIDDMMKIRLNLMRKCNDLVSLVQDSVSMMSEAWLLKDCDRIPIVRSPAKFEHAFCEYNAVLCDCLISGCLELDSQEFAKLSPTAVDILEHVCHVDPRNLEGEVIPNVLSQPMAQLELYLSSFRAMTTLGRKQKSMHVLRMCDLVETAEHVIKATEKTIERQRKIMEETKTFWEMHGQKFLSLKDYRRRVLLNSKQVSIHVAGGSMVNRHWNDWIILMNDILVHSGGYSAFTSHPLKTVWLEGHKNGGGSMMDQGSDGTSGQKHEIVLTMPEETLTLVAPTAEAKSTWFSMLQQNILDSLRAEKNNDAKLMSFSTPPISRTTKYRFQKLIDLKGAEYVGTWLQGKMHGHGVITWPDGRVYRGQIRHNEKHG